MKNQSGNALWFILIAVVLLGGLTMVLSRGSSSVDQSGDVEQARIKMSQLMRYAKSIEAAIQQLQINGCSENEISFQNTTDTNYTNPNAPPDESCHVFEPEGAGLEWRALTDQKFNTTNDMVFASQVVVYGLEDEAKSELLLLVPVSQSLCTQINRELGASTTATDITTDFGAEDDYYTGSYAATNAIGTGGVADALNGFASGCFIDDSGEYAFYHVLLAR